MPFMFPQQRKIERMFNEYLSSFKETPAYWQPVLDKQKEIEPRIQKAKIAEDRLSGLHAALVEQKTLRSMIELQISLRRLSGEDLINPTEKSNLMLKALENHMSVVSRRLKEEIESLENKKNKNDKELTKLAALKPIYEQLLNFDNAINQKNYIEAIGIGTRILGQEIDATYTSYTSKHEALTIDLDERTDSLEGKLQYLDKLKIRMDSEVDNLNKTIGLLRDDAAAARRELQMVKNEILGNGFLEPAKRQEKLLGEIGKEISKLTHPLPPSLTPEKLIEIFKEHHELRDTLLSNPQVLRRLSEKPEIWQEYHRSLLKQATEESDPINRALGVIDTQHQQPALFKLLTTVYDALVSINLYLTHERDLEEEGKSSSAASRVRTQNLRGLLEKLQIPDDQLGYKTDGSKSTDLRSSSPENQNARVDFKTVARDFYALSGLRVKKRIELEEAMQKSPLRTFIMVKGEKRMLKEKELAMLERPKDQELQRIQQGITRAQKNIAIVEKKAKSLNDDTSVRLNEAKLRKYRKRLKRLERQSRLWKLVEKRKIHQEINLDLDPNVQKIQRELDVLERRVQKSLRVLEKYIQQALPIINTVLQHDPVQNYNEVGFLQAKFTRDATRPLMKSLKASMKKLWDHLSKTVVKDKKENDVNEGKLEIIPLPEQEQEERKRQSLQ